MKEKWLNDYSAIAPETTKQSSLLLAITCIFSLIGLLCISTSLSAQPNKKNNKAKATAPIAVPQMPTPPDHIEAVEPAPQSAQTPIAKAPTATEPTQLAEPTMNPKKAEEILSAPSAIEPVMPVEVAQAIAEEKKEMPAGIPTEFMDKVADLESKVQALETKQTLLENELKQLRHQAEQPEEQDIEHSSAPLGNSTEVVVPSIEEVGNEEL